MCTKDRNQNVSVALNERGKKMNHEISNYNTHSSGSKVFISPTTQNFHRPRTMHTFLVGERWKALAVLKRRSFSLAFWIRLKLATSRIERCACLPTNTHSTFCILCSCGLKVGAFCLSLNHTVVTAKLNKHFTTFHVQKDKWKSETFPFQGCSHPCSK